MIKQRHVKPELTSRIARISRCEMGSAYRAPVQIGGRAHSAVQPRALSRKSRGAARLGTADNASPAPGPLRRPPRPVRGPVTGVRTGHRSARSDRHPHGATEIAPLHRGSANRPLAPYQAAGWLRSARHPEADTSLRGEVGAEAVVSSLVSPVRTSLFGRWGETGTDPDD